MVGRVVDIECREVLVDMDCLVVDMDGRVVDMVCGGVGVVG